jgi:hypothetical protein
MTTILESIEEGTRLGTLARDENLPCCTLVACVLLEQAGHHPDPASVDAYAAEGTLYWRDANVWSREAPWSALTAARRLFGGRWAYVSSVGKRPDPFATSYVQPAPTLTRGRWHCIQRWRGLKLGENEGPADDTVIDGAGGHTYLVYMDANGACTVLQSSAALGLRLDTGGTWVGTAGLDGYSVGVLTLPAGVL